MRENGHIFNNAYGGSKDPKGISYELFRILDWRAREIMVSRHLADELKAKHYVIAIKHNGDTLRNLIEYNKPTCYVSHPITYVRKLQAKNQIDIANKIINEIHEFEEEINKNFTAFLPTTIDELRIKKIKGLDNKDRMITELENRWDEEKYNNPQKMMFRKPEKKDEIDPLWNPSNADNEAISTSIEMITRVINMQIDVRDHIMVEQSDVLMVYRPCYDGEVSKGVLEEMKYFNILENKNKKCLVYLPKEDEDNLKIKQFVIHLEKQLTYPKWNKINNSPIFLTEMMKKGLLANFGNTENFDLFFAEIFDELGIRLELEDGPLLQDKTVRSKELRLEFINTYFNSIKELLNTYYSDGNKIIKKKVHNKKIIAKLNSFF